MAKPTLTKQYQGNSAEARTSLQDQYKEILKGHDVVNNNSTNTLFLPKEKCGINTSNNKEAKRQFWHREQWFLDTVNDLNNNWKVNKDKKILILYPLFISIEESHLTEAQELHEALKVLNFYIDKNTHQGYISRGRPCLRSVCFLVYEITLAFTYDFSSLSSVVSIPTCLPLIQVAFPLLFPFKKSTCVIGHPSAFQAGCFTISDHLSISILLCLSHSHTRALRVYTTSDTYTYNPRISCCNIQASYMFIQNLFLTSENVQLLMSRILYLIQGTQDDLPPFRFCVQSNYNMLRISRYFIAIAISSMSQWTFFWRSCCACSNICGQNMPL